MFLPLQPAVMEHSGDRISHHELAETIINAEIGKNSWTLMHRFNLCHDLLAAVDKGEEALVVLFTWLRHSSLQQLDWQRHYSTKRIGTCPKPTVDSSSECV